jgi:hypothetical protein
MFSQSVSEQTPDFPTFPDGKYQVANAHEIQEVTVQALALLTAVLGSTTGLVRSSG